MSENSAAPRIAKWPFFLGDLLLVGVAFWIVKNAVGPMGAVPIAGIVVCMVVGAWLSVQPFLTEYRAQVEFAESNQLNDAVEQIQKMEDVGARIHIASTQLQEAQLQSGKTVAAAREVAERMTEEARLFSEFMAKSNDTEKSHLRLEVEKLRRGEGENIQILVHILDHIYALFRAGQTSGQPNLVRQLDQFQSACRDAARRIGLVPIEGAPGEAFDEARHQLSAEETPAPPAGTRIADTLATGYSFQGQILRRVIVGLESGEMPASIPGAAAAVQVGEGMSWETVLPEEPSSGS